MLARRQFLRMNQQQASAVMRAIAVRGYATPAGPPPTNFRTSRQVMWPGEKDSTLDKLGKYFLLTEMARGMYVLLEQFFRPPYVFFRGVWISRGAIGSRMDGLLTFGPDTPSTTPSKRFASACPPR